MTKSLTHHLETHLGRIVRGWGDDGDIQVVMFSNEPEPGVNTYCTLGLSSTPLPMADGRGVRQEFLVSVFDTYDGEQVASLLLTFADYVRQQRRALLRGDVVGPSAPVVPGTQARALYAAIPVFFPDQFATFHGSEPPTVFVWLIPQPANEAEYVKRVGWERYEDRLEAEGVDFWSLDRPGLT